MVSEEKTYQYYANTKFQKGGIQPPRSVRETPQRLLPGPQLQHQQLHPAIEGIIKRGRLTEYAKRRKWNREKVEQIRVT